MGSGRRLPTSCVAEDCTGAIGRDTIVMDDTAAVQWIDANIPYTTGDANSFDPVRPRLSDAGPSDVKVSDISIPNVFGDKLLFLIGLSQRAETTLLELADKCLSAWRLPEDAVIGAKSSYTLDAARRCFGSPATSIHPNK